MMVLSSSTSQLKVSTLGQSTSTALTVAPRNGFAGTVNLKCEIIPENQATQTGSPTCSLSPAHVGINSNTVGVGTLVISTQVSNLEAPNRRISRYRGISLAGLSLLGLLPFRRLRRKAYITFLSIIFIVGIIGCGYTPNASSGSYKVLITATGGIQANTSISITLEVQ